MNTEEIIEGQHADEQRHGEALDRAGAEIHQHDGGDDGGDVRVDDGGQRVLIAALAGGLDGAAALQFLAEALEDDDVAVNGHADAQQDTGDARQRELNARNQRQA